MTHDEDVEAMLAAAWDAGWDATVHALMHDRPEPKNPYRGMRRGTL